MAILIQLQTDRMGAVTAWPISRKWEQRFADHMHEVTGHRDASAYFQSGPEELIGRIPDRKWRELDQGYGVTCRVDPWDFGHWLGYDAHTVAERG